MSFWRTTFTIDYLDGRTEAVSWDEMQRRMSDGMPTVLRWSRNPSIWLRLKWLSQGMWPFGYYARWLLPDAEQLAKEAK